MKIRTFVVDAFTKEPFHGNPAGVCLLDQPIDSAVMQQIASELNHSETAFIHLKPNEVGQLPIRYFTPTVEVPLCGHATLASSKIVLEKLGYGHVHFLTHFQLGLSARKSEMGITMKFPLYDTKPYQPKKEMLQVLGLPPTQSGRLAGEIGMLLLPVSDAAVLKKIAPNFDALKNSDPDINELVVTCPSPDAAFDFYSRCFCPWIGINEDPVTGVAHSVLAKYWSELLSKKELKAFQASARGGYLELSVKSDTELEITSQAHIVLEGEINL
jgi:PhzF family phenazine biosynthesis protein